MSPTLTQAAIFTAGLACGGISALVLRRRSDEQQPAQVPVGEQPSGSGTKFGTPAPQLIPPKTYRDVAGSVLRLGDPGPLADILRRTEYIAAYDRRLRHPAWTAEHLTPASLRKPPPGEGAERGDRQNSQFKEDPAIPDMFKAHLADYFRSGYDRGHMVPAADAKSSQAAMDETFLLTNIAPQVGAGFNRHYWAYVEEFCRRLTDKFSDVYVFTVPLYLPRRDADGKFRVSYEVIGPPGGPPSISVPTHFAKVILASQPAPQPPAIGAFVLPNAIIPDEAPLRSFEVPVDVVERASGLTLFNPLLKTGAAQLCQRTNCEVIVRRFDDAVKKGPGQGGAAVGAGQPGQARFPLPPSSPQSALPPPRNY